MTNDPEREHDLYVEILCDEQYVGRIQKNLRGELEFIMYGDPLMPVPLQWLMEIGSKVIDELG